MSTGRRSFLKILAVAGGVLGAGGALVWRFGAAAADWYRRLVMIDDSAPGGELSEAELRVLLATVVALVGVRIDARRYEDFFSWKAANAGGYLAIYRAFVRTLDAEARARGATGFATADLMVKAQVIGRAAEVRRMINADDEIGGLGVALFEREWLLFERYVVREILTLFASTDAWLISGYGPYPGLARDLDAYRRAPGARAS